MANGQTITRSVGFAIPRVDKHFTIDEVVFADPGDMTLLGARTLEGLSLVVDVPQEETGRPSRAAPGGVTRRSASPLILYVPLGNVLVRAVVTLHNRRSPDEMQRPQANASPSGTRECGKNFSLLQYP